MYALLLLLAFLLAAPAAAQTDPRTLPKVQPADVQYVGKFLLPMTDSGGWGISWATGIVGITTDGSALYVNCDGNSKAATFRIPAVGQVAQALAPCAGPSNINAVDPGSEVNGYAIGGVLETPTGFVVSAYSFYDGGGDAVKSHWSGPSLSNLTGPVNTGPPGFVGGAMGLLPNGWGGKAFTSLWGIPIISRTSYGSTMSLFDPDNLSTPSQMLLGYPQGHETLGGWDTGGPYYDGTVAGHGVALINGSVLFAAKKGSSFCYGQPSCLPGGVDPVQPYYGTHGFPYKHLFYFFAAADLLLPGANPWDAKPYAMLDLPQIAQTPGYAYKVSMAAYPATGRIYVMEDTNGRQPVVHVYEVATGSTPPPPPPPVEVCGDGIDNDGDGQVDEGCAPPPPPPSVPTVQVAVRATTCTVVATSTPPDATGGWGVQYLIDGTNLGTRATTAPYTRQRSTVTPGSHVVGGTWTKTGAVSVAMAAVPVECK